MRPQNIAVVGATGAVGVEILRVLERRTFPVASLKLLASKRSVGKTLEFKSKPCKVEELTADAFKGVDIAFFSAGATRSREFVPAAKAAGCVVVDNSSAFRMDPNTPLVVPEVNGGDLAKHNGVVANPNCTAAILSVAVWPIHQVAGVKRIIVSTYQSASGAGAAAMQELEDQARDFYVGKLGFEVRTDVTVGDGFRWVTVGHPSQPELELTLMIPGPPLDDEEDYALNVWAGVIPIRLEKGEPVQDLRS